MIHYESLGIAGLYLGLSTLAGDERGSVARVFDAAALQAAGGPALSWVELNQSRSCRGTIRGLHVRRDLRQWKQLRAVRGAVFDVVIDLRHGSATYRGAITLELSGADTHHVIIPPGCAHGFQALSDDTDVSFASTVATDVSLDRGFRFDDASVGIVWPLSPPLVGERDAVLPAFDAVSDELEQAFRTCIANPVCAAARNMGVRA